MSQPYTLIWSECLKFAYLYIFRQKAFHHTFNYEILHLCYCETLILMPDIVHFQIGQIPLHYIEVSMLIRSTPEGYLAST